MSCSFCGNPLNYLLHVQHFDPDALTNAELKALAIYKDVTGRRGIKNEFDAIDSDITEEMLRDWERIISG